MMYPVVLGRGKHLFGNNAQPSAFALAHSTSTPSGVLLTATRAAARCAQERSKMLSQRSVQ